MRYTEDDRASMRCALVTVYEIMRGIDHLNFSMHGVDQSTMTAIDSMMTRAYNVLHEYMQYREQRTREEELWR